MEKIPVGLTYLFNHMKFEFKYDGEIIITDRIYRKKYKLIYQDVNFTIQLLEKDVKDID